MASDPLEEQLLAQWQSWNYWDSGDILLEGCFVVGCVYNGIGPLVLFLSQHAVEHLSDPMLWELANRRKLWAHSHCFMHILMSLCGVYSALGIFQKFQLTTDRCGERLTALARGVGGSLIKNSLGGIQFFQEEYESTPYCRIFPISYLTKLCDFYLFPS